MKDVITNWAKNFTYITWTKKIYAAAGFFLVAWEGGCKMLCILSDLCSDIDGSFIFSELCNGVDGNKRDGKIFANSSSSLLPFFLLPSDNIWMLKDLWCLKQLLSMFTFLSSTTLQSPALLHHLRFIYIAYVTQEQINFWIRFT